jgi:hypothetical protein
MKLFPTPKALPCNRNLTATTLLSLLSFHQLSSNPSNLELETADNPEFSPLLLFSSTSLSAGPCDITLAAASLSANFSACARSAASAIWSAHHASCRSSAAQIQAFLDGTVDPALVVSRQLCLRTQIT